MYEEQFSKRLTELRTQKGVSARDMSLSIGQNPGYIRAIESGTAFPTMANFFYICEYFNITPQEFFNFGEETSNGMNVPCYILKITIYRSDDTMVDKFSQVAGNVPVTNNDPNRRYTVINGYPVVLNFAKEPNPGVFERVRDILLATSYTKKTS